MAEAGFRIYGRVQGVGFRWWTRTRALRLELGGSVRNRPDGSVEVVAAGEPQAIDELHGLLHSGPPGAVVDRVERFTPPASDPAGFRILA